MTTAPMLEDQLRATLQRQAGQAAPRADAADVRRRVQRRRRRRRAVPALGAAAAIVAGVAVTMRQDERAGTSTAAEGDGRANPAMAFEPRGERPPYVELAGWSLERYQEIDIESTLDHVAQVRLRGADHRLVQIQVQRDDGDHAFALASGERPIEVNGARGAVAKSDGISVMLGWQVPGGIATVIAERMNEADALWIAEGVTVDSELRVTTVENVPDGMTVEFLPLIAGSLHDAEYQWGDGSRDLQLHMYDGGQAVYEMRVRDDGRREIEAFGQKASLLDYGNGRYRVDVLVGEHTFEFDGEPFPGLDEFLGTINALQPSAFPPPAEVTAEPVTATQNADGSPSAATVPANGATGTATTLSRPDPGGK